MQFYERKLDEMKSIASAIDTNKKQLMDFIKNEGMKYQLQLNSIEVLKKMSSELTRGIPFLADIYDEYHKSLENDDVSSLRNKTRPAIKTALKVKKYSELFRKSEKQRLYLKHLIALYEHIAPFLIEYRDIDQNDQFLDQIRYTVGNSDEYNSDETRNYLTIDEYNKLSVSERNQLALDRYWKRSNLSNIEIGKRYERYIGHLYETEDYDVEYCGIIKNYEDLGRDLICKKKDNVILIQCKNWAQFKTIHENHIFQFFGTVYQYQYSNKKSHVEGIFYTTTTISKLAISFANEFGLIIKDNFKFTPNYPCIKCNINRDSNEKIYHLPFDQQYDKVKIELKKGEFYASTISEAEDKGYRRAFRYRGEK